MRMMVVGGGVGSGAQGGVTCETLNVGSWEHLEQIPKVTVTFDQPTFAQATFFLIRNISALTDLISMKLLRNY